MKILFLSHKFHPDLGGIEINSEILADQFHAAGHEVRVMTWSAGEETRNFKYPILRNPGFSALMRAHYEAEVVFENNPCLRLAWPNLFFRKPLVTALNTWVNRMDGRVAWQDRLKRWWLRRARNVIAVSEALRRRTFDKAIVIGNPYQAERFRIMREITKDRDFVFLGRLVSDKGAALAVEAIARLGTRFGGISLTIVGDGPELPDLVNQVAGFGLQNQITFTGALSGEELVRMLNSHRFILIPSVWEEPFGNVALEGIACGCIPIGSDGGGLPDAIGGAGLLFKRGHLEGLVKSMQELLGNPRLVAELRAAGSDHLKNHLPDLVAAKYLEVFSASLVK